MEQLQAPLYVFSSDILLVILWAFKAVDYEHEQGDVLKYSAVCLPANVSEPFSPSVPSKNFLGGAIYSSASAYMSLAYSPR